MKKLIITAIIGAAVLTMGFAGLQYASAAESTETGGFAQMAETFPAADIQAQPEHRRGPGGRNGAEGPLAPYAEEATADILGLTVEELQAAREDGTRLPELIEAAGLTKDEFKAAMEEAMPEVLAQAVEDGVLTQEQADAIASGERPDRPEGKHGKRGGGQDGPLETYKAAAAADILGLTVEELQAAREDGTRLPELIEAAGLTEDEFKAAMEEAQPEILAQAVEDGVLTQEQADAIAAGERPEGPKDLLKPYAEEATADILGLTVEELQAAREDGTRMPELIEAAGLTNEEFKAAMDAAKADILAQAVEDGVITQEQADSINERDFSGPRQNGPHDHGRRGPRGGNGGPGGPGNGGPGQNQDGNAPFNGLNSQDG